ncbi:MAG TPA: TIGR02996 domain-containing protein [Gemmata sp.]
MNERDALFSAILSDPADDTARLALADRLDETGEHSRAEFIRVQVALANTPDTDPAHDALAERERQLLHAHSEKWKRELQSPGVMFWGAFRRGFVNELRIYEPAQEDPFDDPLVRANFPEGSRLEQVVTPTELRAAFVTAPLQKS